ncbi:MAG: DUF3990 domain-containing protein [Oscillospiraceae bacterium]|nr:DUF3990 domain-containing protein [Oscillospiraceae bacterium]
MLLYHGSKEIIPKPKYNHGNAHNDYGKGFYCTEHIELAREWACQEPRDGFVNQYELATEELRILRLTQPDYHILNWLAILLENRTFELKGRIAFSAKEYVLREFLPEYRSYDVIIGYRADDSYFSFARDFINNAISLQQLGKAMYLGSLGEQVVPISRKAFSALQYLGHEYVDGAAWYPKYTDRDTAARKAYAEESSKEIGLEEITVLDILRRRMKNEDIFTVLQQNLSE